MYVTIADMFEQTVSKYPGKEALYDVYRDLRWTYGEWDLQVNRLSNALAAAGVGKGDRVSVLLYNGYEFVTTYFACAKLGAVFNPINFRLKAPEIDYIVRDAAPTVLIFERALEGELADVAAAHPGVAYWSTDDELPAFADGFHDNLRRASGERPARDVDEMDVCSVMYTSGTTGNPKGVLHRHRELLEQSAAMIAAMHYLDRDRGLIVNPLYHCGELHSGFFARVHIGAGNIVMRHFQAKQALELIERERVTTMVAVPTIWKMLLQEDLSEYDLGSLRYGMYGGEAMSPGMIADCLQQFGIELVQAYGMTEMGPTISLLTFSKKNPPLDKAGSAGKAVLNHEIRVVRFRDDGPSDPNDRLPEGEVGEIVVRGSCAMAGYLNNPKATNDALAGGWYRTGDLGYFDGDGCLWVVDRKNNMIVSGGENIYPREVEQALSAHPAVREIAVVGAPDPKWGETVVAFVVKKSEVSEVELDDFCKKHVANYKRPRRYQFIDEIPRNGSGKVLYHILKELAKKPSGMHIA